MKRSFTTGLAAIAVLLALAACRVAVDPVDPGPPIADRDVTSRTSPDAPVATIALAPGQSALIRVSIPSGQRHPTDRRLVVEADDDGGFSQIDLVLYGPTGTTPTASTSGIAYFRPGLQGLGEGDIGPGAAALARRAEREVERHVDVVGRCFGPCVSRRADVSTVFVEITNRSTFHDNVPFYAYTGTWIDPREPQNDTPGGAVAVSPASPYRGAIERLGDVDFVRFTQTGFVAFDERPGYDVNLVLDLFAADGTFVERVRPGDPAFGVLANEYAVIQSLPTARRASVYGFYDVFYNPD